MATMADEGPSDVRVMSFNIRYGTAPDGVNDWTNRRAFLAETIRAFGPDLLGTQETLDFQRDYLRGQLPGHDHLAAGREDGKAQGEMTALFFRRDRFERLEGGHFWLSDTPDRPGSKGWDAALPRMATWVKLRDRKAPGEPPLLFLNTHLDHVGGRARLEAARLLRRRLATMGAGCRIVATGDFNAGEGSGPYRALFGPEDGAPPPLIDAFRAAHPAPAGPEGTFSGFRAASVDGPRIDWIGVYGGWEVREATIDRSQRDGRTPSDHFPVTVVLQSRREPTPSRPTPPRGSP